MTTESRLQIVESTREDVTWVDLDTVADLSGLHPEMIEEFVRADVVSGFLYRGAVYFDENGLYRLRQIRALHIDSGLNIRTVRLIIDLIDRLEYAENEVHRLRERMR